MRPRHAIPVILAALLLLAAHATAAPDTDDANNAQTTAQTTAQTAAQQSLEHIQGLEHAQAQITGSTITITGTADDSATREQAEQAVRDATGLEQVDNQIDLSLNLQDRTRGAANRVSDRLEDWVAYLPLIPLAILILIAFALASWLVGKLTWPFSHITKNLFLQNILRKLAQGAVLLFGVLLALEVLDAMALVGGVLGAAGVAGIAIGFAFKDLIENYIASILLSLRHPFRPQDHVVIDAHEGLVTAMSSRSTVLTTFDGNTVRIPNATVFKTTIINYTTDPRRRFSFTAGVGYDVNLAQALEVGVKTIAETRGVLAEPKPFAIVTNLGDSSITVQLFGWVDQSTTDFGKVRSNAMQNVKAQYDRFNIDMPEPIYKIRIEGQTPMTHTPHAPEPTKAAEPPTPDPGAGAQAQTPAPAQPAATADVSPDKTISDMSEQAGRQQGEDNLLSDDAPQE